MLSAIPAGMEACRQCLIHNSQTKNEDIQSAAVSPSVNVARIRDVEK